MKHLLWGLVLLLAWDAGFTARADEEEDHDTTVSSMSRPEDLALGGKALIDKHFASTWRKQKLTPSETEDSLKWMRRAYLDLLGRIPTQQEIGQFIGSKGDRAGLCDSLVEQPDFSKNLAFIWMQALSPGMLPQYFGEQYQQQVQQDLERRFASGDSWNKIAPDILATSSFQVLNSSDNRETETETAARAVLGIRVECSKCHNQPDLSGGLRAPANVSFSKMLTQKEYVALNAVFNGETGLARGATREGEVFTVRPGFGGKTGSVASIFTTHDSFAKAFVNRTVGMLFGRGLNSADVDDFRVDDRVNHPELLRDLSAKFAADGYRPKELVKWLCKSNAYNLSSKLNESNKKDERYFSHGPTKRMTTFQLANSLAVATGQQQSASSWLQFVKREGFEDNPGRLGEAGLAIPGYLALMNSQRVNDAIKASPLLKAPGDPASRVKLLYLNTIARVPSDAETQNMVNLVARAKTAEEGYENVLWALLNSNEFIINH